MRIDEPLYRYGGEEFLWLLKCKSPEEAIKSARRVLALSAPPRCRSLTIKPEADHYPGARGEMEDMSSVIKRADLALYEGKKSGRDRYVIAHP